jgi:VWFA-related protein
MFVRAVPRGLVSLCLLAAALRVPAQSPATPPPLNPQVPTLHMSTRVVLTDVTVTDSHGNPIHGLPRSAFHIFDDGRPQSLDSFEEHTQSQSPALTPVAAPANPNVFTNDFLLHPPSPVNVILIDTTTIRLTDQMYVYQQLTSFVKSLPPTEPIAIFNRSGDITLLLQNFTTDHALLLAAIRRAVPQFRSPDAWYTNDFDTLQQMATYLSQIPGRKNLLWFSSGSNLFLDPDPTIDVDQPPRRPLYDLLESERISIYPIDARGLTVSLRPGMIYQQMQMQQDAQATGGKAYYNNNGLAKIAARIVSTDASYYTLSYSPQDLQRDGKWHHVKVKLDDSRYHLSYRHGYYDDGSNNRPPPGPTRTVLRADGSRAQVPNEPGEPIIFQASVVRSSVSSVSLTPVSGSPSPQPQKGQTTYIVHYILPAAAIQPRRINGNIGTDVVGAAIIAFNHFGDPVARVAQDVTMSVDQNKLRSFPNAALPFDQQVNLPNGLDYLYLMVWDTTTGRLGTINLPIDVKKPTKPKP